MLRVMPTLRNTCQARNPASTQRDHRLVDTAQLQCLVRRRPQRVRGEDRRKGGAAQQITNDRAHALYRQHGAVLVDEQRIMTTRRLQTVATRTDNARKQVEHMGGAQVETTRRRRRSKAAIMRVIDVVRIKRNPLRARAFRGEAKSNDLAANRINHANHRGAGNRSRLARTHQRLQAQQKQGALAQREKERRRHVSARPNRWRQRQWQQVCHKRGRRKGHSALQPRMRRTSFRNGAQHRRHLGPWSEGRQCVERAPAIDPRRVRCDR